jgi:tripartite-type tricarboxylate transporter receptor subunit TctC
MPPFRNSAASLRFLAFGASTLIGALLMAASTHAHAAYYQGKTITIVQGRDPGGTGDMRVRAMLPYLKKHIPGNPNIVVEYMPGGGSRKAANHVFQSAAADGLMIGNLSSGMVSAAVLGVKGVLYDLDKFFYLGSPFSSHIAIFVTRKEADLGTLEKLRAATGIRVGGQSVGFSVYNEARLFSYILGLKEPKFVTGYSGTELDVALQRGEIDARSSAADSMTKRNREWLDKGLVHFHASIEVPKGEKHPQFAQVPDLETFAGSGRDRKVLALQRAFRVTGQPFVLPPKTAMEHVKVLQAAFRKTYEDPQFHKEYKKFTADEPTPLLPENHEKAIQEIPQEPEVIGIFKQVIGAGPLPSR